MASSYLVLINNVLRDLNEVELTSSTFSSSRGIQTAVKDYVNRAIDGNVYRVGWSRILYTKEEIKMVNNFLTNKGTCNE